MRSHLNYLPIWLSSKHLSKSFGAKINIDAPSVKFAP